MCGGAENLEMGAIVDKESEVHKKQRAAHGCNSLPPGITDQDEGDNSEGQERAQAKSQQNVLKLTRSE